MSNENLVDQDLPENPYQIGLKIKMNIIYNDQRSKFLVSWVRLEKFIIVTSLLSTVAFLKNTVSQELTYVCTGFAALLTVVLLIWNIDEEQRKSQEQGLQWRHAFKIFEELGGEAMNSEGLRKIREEVAKINVEGSPVNYARRRIAQNEVLQQINAGYRIKQSSFSRFFAQLYDFSKHTKAVMVPVPVFAVDDREVHGPASS